jgi:hypothetical protein
MNLLVYDTRVTTKLNSLSSCQDFKLTFAVFEYAPLTLPLSRFFLNERGGAYLLVQYEV